MSPPLDIAREQIVGLLPRLRRFARTLAGNAHDADDLAQMAVERALAKYEQLHHGSSIAGWLFGITKNAWMDEIRARTRREQLASNADETMSIADPAAEAHVEVIAVEEVLLRLPDEQRLVVALVLIEGLSYKEAAEALEIPIGTLTSRLARARTTVQELLQDAAPGGAR